VALASRIADEVEPRAAVETIHVRPPARRERTSPGIDAQVHLEGEPTDALAAHSGSLDLLVLGSRGRGRAGAVVLGSVAARLIGIAHCPVIALPSDASTADTLAVMGDVAADR
jgi:nucleotide-binding universal stress UspA family protein